MISNYSYEQIKFNYNKQEIQGEMYNITGYDRTRIDGEKGTLFKILLDKEKIVIPLFLEKDLKGLFISQQYELNNLFSKNILIGDKYSLIDMPIFRGNSPSFHLPFSR